MCSVNSIVKVTTKNKWIQIVGFWLSGFIYFEHFPHIAQAIDALNYHKGIYVRVIIFSVQIFLFNKFSIFNCPANL